MYICAGYTGGGTSSIWIVSNVGTPNALLCAEAMAMIILGKNPPKYFPQIYLVTDERSRKHHGLREERNQESKIIEGWRNQVSNKGLSFVFA
jgi:hypothetical protein